MVADHEAQVPGNSSLTILVDEQDLACIEACRPRALEGTVLVFELDLHLALLDRGLPHLTPWDLVDRSDWPAIRQFRQELWQFWLAHAQVRFEGIDVLGMALYRHAAWVSVLAWAAWVARAAIRRVRPAELITFEEPVGHGLTPPLGCNKMPTLFMLARGIAEQESVRVNLIRREEQSGRPPWCDAMAKNSDQKLDAVDPAELMRGRSVVLFAGSGADLVRQLPLIRELEGDGRFTPVQVYRAASESQVAEIRRAGHVVWHDSQLTQTAPRIERFDFVEEGRKAFEQACRQCPPQLVCVLRNPHLRPHFDFLFGRYSRTLAQHALSWTHVFSRFRPRAVVVNHGTPLADVAVHMGIPGIALSHGMSQTANPELMTYMRGFHIGAISPEHRNRLLRYGMAEQYVHLTGDPRVDEILGEIESLSGQDAERVRRETRSRLGLEENHRAILLATGRMALHAHAGELPYVDWADALRCMDELTQVAARHPDWRWLIRPHPRFDQPRLYDRFNARVPERLQMIAGGKHSLDELVLAGDAVVVFNAVTSALVESSFHARPAMVLEASIRWSNPDDSGMSQWPHVSSVAKLEQLLESIFTDSSRYEQSTWQTAEALKDYLGGEPRRAIPSCIQLIEAMAAGQPPE